MFWLAEFPSLEVETYPVPLRIFRELRLIQIIAQILPLLSIIILISVDGDSGVARLLVLGGHQVPALGQEPQGGAPPV